MMQEGAGDRTYLLFARTAGASSSQCDCTAASDYDKH